MTIQDLGSIGEFVAAIATLITLVYLAIQIRHNTRELRRGEERARIDALDETLRSFNLWRGEIADDRQTAEVWSRGLVDPGSLDEVDRICFQFLVASYFYSMQAMYRRAKNAGATETWEKGLMQFADMLANPGVAVCWAASRDRLLKEFVSAVGNVVEP